MQIYKKLPIVEKGSGENYMLTKGDWGEGGLERPQS